MQDITIQTSHNVLIPPRHISVSVDNGIGNYELDNIGVSDMGKKLISDITSNYLSYKTE